MIPAIYDLLSTDPVITGLVGDRIYPLHRPKGTGLPAIVIRVEEMDPIGCKSNSNSVRRYMAVLDVHTKTYASLDGLCDVLENSLHRYAGTHAGVNIRDMIWQPSEEGDYDPETMIYSKTLNFETFV